MYQDWLAAKHFVMIEFPLLAILCLILLAALIIGVTYGAKRARLKWFLVGGLGVMLLSGAWIWRGFVVHQEMLSYFTYLSPAVRDRESFFLTDTYYPQSEVNRYQGSYFLDSFAALPMYEGEELTKTIEYGGQAEGYYYFKEGQAWVNSERLPVVFTDQVSQPTLVAQRFHLKDPRFLEEGFLSPSSIYLTELRLPRALESQVASEPIQQQAKYIVHRRLGGWLLPS